MKNPVLLITALLITLALSGCDSLDSTSDSIKSRPVTGIQSSVPVQEKTSEQSERNKAEKHENSSVKESSTEAEQLSKEESASKQVLVIEVNGSTLYADFEANTSADALREKLSEGSITLEMSDYGGFEKVGKLTFSLVTNDEQITTSPGDVILYQGDKLTIYYDTNTWSFTKVAKIRDSDSSLKDLLGDGTVWVTLSLKSE